MQHILHALFIAKREDASALDPNHGPFRLFPTLPAPWCDQQALAQIIANLNGCSLKEAFAALKVVVTAPDDAEPFWCTYEMPTTVAQKIAALHFDDLLNVAHAISELQWTFASSPDQAATIMHELQGFCRIAVETGRDLYHFDYFDFKSKSKQS